MKKLSKYFSSTKGFTLVELLVVIGVLGILAAGLLATIDPLEQFRKGQDNNRREASVELVNALTRYYASYSTFPWGGNNSSLNATNVASLTGSYLSTLISAGELKSTFTLNTALLQELTLSYAAGGNVVVCFSAQSKALKGNSTETRWDSSGGGSVSTFWCAR